MRIIKTKFFGLKIVKSKKNNDLRGNLVETYRKKILKGKNLIFDYKVLSKKNVLRGLHFQYNFQQIKYVTVLKGRVLDCVVDLRRNSKTFGKTFKMILSDKNCLSLYVPEGFAHSYYSYKKTNIVYYKLTNYYKPQFESGINVLDKSLKINWPSKKLIISKKDKILPNLSDFKKKFKTL